MADASFRNPLHLNEHLVKNEYYSVSHPRQDARFFIGSCIPAGVLSRVQDKHELADVCT